MNISLLSPRCYCSFQKYYDGQIHKNWDFNLNIKPFYKSTGSWIFKNPQSSKFKNINQDLNGEVFRNEVH